MKIRTIKLGVPVIDKATKMNGALTHWICDMSGKVTYLFQPKGLNSKNGQPLKKIVLPEDRLIISEDMYEEVEVPSEILGTTITDKASGFSGMATDFVRHIHGCFHVLIQPSGVQQTGSPVKKADFALIGCEGEMIAQLTEEEVAKEKRTRPSPDPIASFDPSFGNLTALDLD